MAGRELYPYTMKLSSIAESQENGVFKDSEGGIPQGMILSQSAHTKKTWISLPVVM